MLKLLFLLFIFTTELRAQDTEFSFLRFDVANKVESEHKIAADQIMVERKMFPSFNGHQEEFELETTIRASLNTSEKSLLGIYPRQRVQAQSQYPARTVGLLNGNCTATLIGPAHLLTAAHCVFDRVKQRFHDSFYFSPAQTLSFEPFGGTLGRTIYMPKEFALTGGAEHDYALILLDDQLGVELGWMGFAPFLKEKGEDLLMNLQGYPGDKEFATAWKVSCPLMKKTELLGGHLCDTFSGMSGSSFYRFTDIDQTLPVVHGIHIFGKKNSNGARLISNEVFDQLVYWMKATDVSLYDSFVDSKNVNPPDEKLGHDIYFKNSCHEPVRVAIKVKNSFGYSTTHHWKMLYPGERAYIASTQKKSYEFYADTPNASFSWSGEMRGCQFLRGDTRVFCFIKRDLIDVEKRYNLDFDIIEEVLNCNGLVANDTVAI